MEEANAAGRLPVKNEQIGKLHVNPGRRRNWGGGRKDQLGTLTVSLDVEESLSIRVPIVGNPERKLRRCGRILDFASQIEYSQDGQLG